MLICNRNRRVTIKWCDARIKGGLGVMFDDILAALYAILVMLVATRLGVFG